MSGKNGIDKAIEEIEELMADAVSEEWYGLRDARDVVKNVCADLLGKPLVDARNDKNEPLNCFNCMMFDCEYEYGCTMLDRDTRCDKDAMEDYVYQYDYRAKDCPIKWEVQG